MKTRLLIVLCACSSVSLSGCASHLVSSGLPEGSCAAGQCHENQLSILGAQGLNNKGASGEIAQQCDGRPYTRVEVRRNLGQGLATVLTLGTVNPATIHFDCAKPGQGSFISCNTIDGSGGPDAPVQILCTKNETAADPEAFSFECTTVTKPENPTRIHSFTCEAEDLSFSLDGLIERKG